MASLFNHTIVAPFSQVRQDVSYRADAEIHGMRSSGRWLLYRNQNTVFAISAFGLALDELQRYKEALAAYDESIRLDPNNSVVYHTKGVILEQLGRREEAQQACKKTRQLSGRN